MNVNHHVKAFDFIFNTTKKKEKAGDSNAIKACDEETKEMMKQIFNEVLKQRDCTPEARRRIRIKVIFRKGERSW